MNPSYVITRIPRGRLTFNYKIHLIRLHKRDPFIFSPSRSLDSSRLLLLRSEVVVAAWSVEGTRLQGIEAEPEMEAILAVVDGLPGDVGREGRASRVHAP